MGLDVFNVTCGIERKFGVRPGQDDYQRLAFRHEPPDITAGDLHDLICELCRAAAKPLPYSSWSRVKLILIEALGVKPQEVRKDARLFRDLGME